MSYEIYGFVDFTEQWANCEAFLRTIQKLTILGVHQLDDSPGYPSELTGFPAEVAPSLHSCRFAITDRPESPTAAYLVDMLNYAPQADLPLPHQGIARIELLCSCLEEMYRESGGGRLCVLITECSQVDSITRLPAAALRQTLLADCEEISPPNVLYWIE